MFRLRRYRVFLIGAFVITVLLYHVSKNSQSSQHAQAALYGQPKPVPLPPPPPDSKPPPISLEPPSEEKEKLPGQLPPAPPSSPPSSSESQSETSEEDNKGQTAGNGQPAPAVPDRKPPAKIKEEDGRPVAVATQTEIHWTKPSEWFPVPEESLILLPSGEPKPIPTVQFKFGTESSAAKKKREARLEKVKAETKRAWSAYKQYAWGHDELTPVSKSAKDPFCGWAATLVDSLDTLWIMGLTAEFDDAVKAVANIDFTTTKRDDIPVFETTIRYLGGLVGAYDVSGQKPKYKVLLDKAVELAEILMSIFDTPNRMPILYYQWQPQYNENPKRASTNAGIAELGTLSMEFTRLAQLTGKNKYYDAIARITDALEEFQNRPGGTALPGIFPENLDISGCNRTAKAVAQNTASEGSHRQNVNAKPKNDDEGELDIWKANGYTTRDDMTELSDSQEADASSTFKRDAGVSGRALPAGWGSECGPQNITGAYIGSGTYSMGGSQDSAYEYFPKQYLLLGGLEAKYRAMHEKTVEAVKKYLLYRPMAENDPDVLFSAKATSRDNTDVRLSYDFEVTHLTCFLGGMFGLGGKLFDRPEDVTIAKKLADGCVWAYNSMPAGVMAEWSNVMPCDSMDDCKWNQTAWHNRLEPNSEAYAQQMEQYYDKLDEWNKEVERIKKEAATLKTQIPAGKRADEEKEKESDNKGDSPLSKRTEDSETLILDPETEKEVVKPRDPAGDGQKELKLPEKPKKPMTHAEVVEQRITRERIPPGFVSLNDRRYILRPEAIESVWYMYRITGDTSWQDKGWRMFEAVIAASRTEIAHSAVQDVTVKPGADPARPISHTDSMESFWLAETLKYFYLLFAEPDVISLDEWVLNTEAHPFRRPDAKLGARAQER